MASKDPVRILINGASAVDRKMSSSGAYSVLRLISLFSLLLLLSSNVCLAEGQQRQQNQCQFERLSTPKPNRRVESEGGISEYWDFQGPDVEELKCAGVSVARYTIKTKALLLPYISSASIVYYVLEGKALHGAAMTGCAQSYESGILKESEGYESLEYEEQHQKVREIKHGDIVAKPAGVADWVYNYGNKTLILIAFIHSGNQANQFNIFTNYPTNEQQVHLQSHERSLQGQKSKGNIFGGLDVKTLARAFNIKPELASKLQSQNSLKEGIVLVGEDFRVLTHALMKKHKPHRRSLRANHDFNGAEETFCNYELRHNIDDPDQSDIFNLRGGRITTVTGLTLPVLSPMGLTAERAVVYDNSMMSPYFNLNSHTVYYVTYGSGRVQVADDNGRNLFDGEIKSDDVFVVPANHVVVKETTGPSLEWIAVKTSDNAVRTLLAGRISVIRALPDDIVATTFGITREEAQTLKYSREEVTLFRPSTPLGDWKNE